MEIDERKYQNKVLLFIVLFSVFFKFITFRMFDIGGDAIHYWVTAKTILSGLPYGELDHQTTRFGIILPIYLSQLIFGTHPIVSTIVPNLLMLIQIIIIYRIGVIVHSVQAGFISAILFVLCPYIIQWGGQILPPAFEGPAVTLSFYFLLLYYKNEKKEILYLSLSALMLFWAYLSKETAIYFMPAFLAAIIMFKKKYKHAIIYSLILFILFLGETGLYYFNTGDPLARLHSITGNHLKGDFLVQMRLIDLPYRYIGAQLFWRIPFFIYLVLLIPVFRIGNVKTKSIVITGLVFFILLMISVKSINPLIPALPFKMQYPIVGLPFMLLTIVIGAIELFRYIQRRRKRPVQSGSVKFYACTLTAIALLILLVTSTGILPDSVGPFYNKITNLSEHKFIRFFKYHTIFNKAYNDHIPIVSDYYLTLDDVKKNKQAKMNIDKGMSIEEACKAVGIDIRRYSRTKPWPHVISKGLNLVGQVFLDASPDRIPVHYETVLDDKVYFYILNSTMPRDALPNLKKNTKVLYAVTGEYYDLEAVEGVF